MGRERWRSRIGLGLALAVARPAMAQGTSADLAAASQGEAAPADIVVTARRREERAQDVPIALNVVGREALERTGSFTLGDVQRLVPALQIFSLNPRNTNINIRGLGSNIAITNDGLDNGVGVYVDGVYYARVGQSQFDLVDLDRVEVLRGPQGTLFGRNTTAGAISISSRQPSFTAGFDGEATIGNHDFGQVRGSLTGPIVDGLLAFRLSADETHRNGFINNVRTGEDTQNYNNQAVRGQLLLTPDDALSVRLIGDWSRQRLNCCVQLPATVFDSYTDGTPVANGYRARIARAGYAGLPVDPFARRTDADARYFARMNGWGLSGQVDWRLGGLTLTSVTAYRRWNWTPANDNDAIGLPVLAQGTVANRERQFSEELRLASAGTNRITYTAGLYYLYERNVGHGATRYGAAAANWFLPTLPAALGALALDGFEADSLSTPTTRSVAPFGQATWHVTDRLSLTGGLRFTHERKDARYAQFTVAGASLAGLPAAAAGAVAAVRNAFNPATDYRTSLTDNSLSGQATLSYKLAPDMLAYASYSRGAKSGGLNLAVLPAGVSPRVAPEKVDDYELGLKTQLLDRRLTLNLAGFWTDVRDYQTLIVDFLSATSSVQYIANIPKVRTRGLEGDAALTISRHASVGGSVAYTDAAYRRYRNSPAPVEQDPALGPTADLGGRPLPGVPRWSYTVGGDADQPLGRVSLYGHADYSHRSRLYTVTTDSFYSIVRGYGLTTVRVGLRTADGRWDLSAFARNLFDVNYFQTLTPTNTGLVTGITGDPRTFGVTLRARL